MARRGAAPRHAHAGHQPDRHARGSRHAAPHHTDRGLAAAAWFESQSAEGLQIRVPCDSGCERLTTRAWSSLRQVDALVRGPGSVKHAVIGGLLGGAATYVVMFAVASKSQCSWDAGSCPAVGAAELTPGLVSVGTLLGASLGWTTSRDRWETVWTFDAPEPR
jgi:hypothetical protein